MTAFLVATCVGIVIVCAILFVLGLAHVAGQEDCACPYECEYHPTPSSAD